MDLSVEMILRAQRGEATAQASLLRQVVPAFRALLRRLGQNFEREDQLQELLTHLLSVLPQFRVEGPAKFSTWAYTVAHRFVLMERRRRRLTVEPLNEVEEPQDR